MSEDRTRRALGRPKPEPPPDTTPEPQAAPSVAPGGAAARVLALEAELEALREAIRMERLVSEHAGNNRGLCALVRTSPHGGAIVAVADSQGICQTEELLLLRVVEAIRHVDFDRSEETKKESDARFSNALTEILVEVAETLDLENEESLRVRNALQEALTNVLVKRGLR